MSSYFEDTARWAECFHDEVNGHVVDLERDGLRQVVPCPWLTKWQKRKQATNSNNNNNNNNNNNDKSCLELVPLMCWLILFSLFSNAPWGYDQRFLFSVAVFSPSVNGGFYRPDNVVRRESIELWDLVRGVRWWIVLWPLLKWSELRSDWVDFLQVCDDFWQLFSCFIWRSVET